MEIGSGVLLKKSGKFLLQLRDNISTINNPNTWGLFGGGAEKGESPKETAIRELKEELNLQLKKSDLSLIYSEKNKSREIHIYLTELNRALSELKLNEGQDMRLFTKEEIANLKNIRPELRTLIKKI